MLVSRRLSLEGGTGLRCRADRLGVGTTALLRDDVGERLKLTMRGLLDGLPGRSREYG